MNTKSMVLLSCLVASSATWSFNCYFTLAKDNCWQKYNVTVVVKDVGGKEIKEVNIPAGKSWVRESFTCTPSETLTFVASFSPVFWENDKNKTYNSQTNWTLPAEIKPGDKAWNLSICFSKDFVQVPMTPEATSSCVCDFSEIPEIPPQ